MRIKIVSSVLMVTGLTLAMAIQVWAFPQFARQNKLACATCHVSPAGGPALTEAGTAFKADKTKVPATVAGAEYVGGKKCMMCHPKQHKAWLDTPHQQSFALLKTATEEKAAAFAKNIGVELKGKPSESEECLTCHVTGFKLAGGYPAADSTKNASLQFVGCEGCHGPGSKHVAAPMADKKKMIYGAVTANMCTQCHTATISPKFDFAEMKKKGVHQVPVAKTSG